MTKVYKTIVEILFLLLISSGLLAQETNSTLEFPETMPGFVDDAMQYLEFDVSHKADLMAGKVIFTGMPDMEVLDEQLVVVGVMLIIDRPMNDIVDLMLAGETFRANSKLVDFGLISPSLSVIEVTGETFTAIDFAEGEKSEINKLLRVSPGTLFNLSTSEIALFRAIDGNSKNKASEVLAVYREILKQRYSSYLLHGVQGIDDYARRKNSIMSPADELTISTESAWFVKKHFPDFHNAILSFPGSNSPYISHRFYWLKKTMDERPNLVLSHHTILKTDEYAIALDQHYYASHSYNAMHTLIGLVPFAGGTLILSSNRTFTDKVLGFASGLKHRKGRKIMANLMAERFTNLKQILEQQQE